MKEYASFHFDQLGLENLEFVQTSKLDPTDVGERLQIKVTSFQIYSVLEK